jgi:23S rRNA (uridine2552-2'-O)-methyltransferase
MLSHARLASSHAWITRQFRDPYVRQRLSHPAAYRSRSAFKLLELDNKYGGFLTRKDVRVVVDLGAAPGGWAQVVAGKMGWLHDQQQGTREVAEGVEHDFKKHTNLEMFVTPNSRPHHQLGDDELESSNIDKTSHAVGKGTIIAVDLLPILPIPGVQTLKIDFLSPQADRLIKSLLTSDDNTEGKADVILSDMAANISGNRIHDIESSLQISHAVLRFAKENLSTAKNIGRQRGGVLLYV